MTTSAFIVASIAAGELFEQGIDLPFWFFVIGIGISLVLGLLILRGAGEGQAAASQVAATP